MGYQKSPLVRCNQTYNDLTARNARRTLILPRGMPDRPKISTMVLLSFVSSPATFVLFTYAAIVCVISNLLDKVRS